MCKLPIPTLILLFVSKSSSLIFAETNCTDLTTYKCAAKITHVSDRPDGPIDGKNLVFTLNATPIGARVSLFVGKSRLTEGVNFRLDGQTLTLEPAWAPHIGESLRVEFDKMESAPAPTRQLLIPADQTRRFVRQALSDALRREEVPPLGRTVVPTGNAPSEVYIGSAMARIGHIVYPEPDASADQARTASNVADSPKVSHKAPESLLLLTRRINEARPKVRRQPTNGFEGTGDLPIASPYSILLDGETNRASGRTLGFNDGQGKLDGRSFRSIVMLERRLDAADSAPPEEPQGVRR